MVKTPNYLTFGGAMSGLNGDEKPFVNVNFACRVKRRKCEIR